MTNALRQRYKIEKNNIEQAYEYQLALKHNQEYEDRVDTTFLAFMQLFQKKYPKVKIEAPRGREKSQNSLKNKIKHLEIERLCKLYATQGIFQAEKENLCEFIKSTMDEKKHGMVEKIMFGEIKNLKTLEALLKEEDVTDHMKTALLRITKTRLQRENSKNSDVLQREIEEKYGQTAAEKSKQLKDNLLHWECIENMKQEDLEKLHCPSEYLKIKDLRGMKIIVAEVPDDVQTDNEELKQWIEERNKVPKEEQAKYNDLCCIALTQEFAKEIMENQEFLKELNIQVLVDGYKHKEKQNGYIAEHLKFCFIDHPEYMFELQLRSMYRENLSRANGKAAHDKRSGKKRIFPNTANKEKFLEELNDRLPKYTLLKQDEEKNYYIHKCSMFENVLEYYLGYIQLDSKEFKKATEYIKEEEEIQK